MREHDHPMISITERLTRPASHIQCQPPAHHMLFNELIRSMGELISTGNIRFSVVGDESAAVDKWTREMLPQLSDGSFEDYHHRITQQLNANSRERKRYQFVINDLELFSSTFRDWLLDFWEPVYSSVGHPTGHTYSALFVGDYKLTTFGIHYDDEYVYHIPLIGTKRMDLWDVDKASLAHVRSSNAESDIAIHAAPGNCLFWPPNYWHVSTQTGELSVSLATACTVGVTPTRLQLAWDLPRMIARSNRTWKGFDAAYDLAFQQRWADNVRAQLARRKAFTEGTALPTREESRKAVLGKLMARAQEDLKPSVSRNVPKLPTEARYVLETKRAPLVHRSRHGTFAAMNGYVSEKGDAILEAMDALRKQTVPLAAPTAADLRDAFRWLLNVRAIRLTD